MDHKGTIKKNDEPLAAKRIGKTAEDRLRWVIEFAQKDMNALRSGEKLALGEDLRELVPSDWKVSSKASAVDEPTVIRIHRSVCQGISDLLNKQRQKWKLPRSITGLTLSRSGGVYHLTGEFGDFESGVILGVFNLILRVGNRLKACPECNNAFVAVRRQIFCSTVCSQRSRDEKKREKRIGE